MKIGDKVRVIGIPENLPDTDMGTKQLFEQCLGRIFPIQGFLNGQVELCVGEFVEVVETSN